MSIVRKGEAARRDYAPIPGEAEGLGSPHGKGGASFTPTLLSVLGYMCLICVLSISWYKISPEYDSVYTSTTDRTVSVYQTSFAGDRFLPMSTQAFKERGIPMNSIAFGNSYESSERGPAGVGSVAVDPQEVFQEILGFGGAFTEASALNYQKLPPSVQRKVIELYFGESGIGYRMGRIHINSCDFSVQSYSFDDSPGDYELNDFDTSVKHDQEAIIPLIRDATAAIKTGSLRLLASPWSPPAWMKVPVHVNVSYEKTYPTQSMLGSAKPNGLMTHAQQTWASYISKFIEAYAQQGVSVWAITPQNEPEFAAPWEACVYTAQFQAEFIAHYLGPTLRKEHPELLLFGFDHNKDHLQYWADVLYGNESTNSAAAQFVDGMAFHWYNGVDDRQLDGTNGYDAVLSTHLKYPDKLLLATEGCSCPGVLLGNWLRAERLGHDLMFDVNNWANGWLDWNLIVDSRGGPNHLNNNCDAPIIVNSDFSDVLIQPKYFFMGHFSKYVPPGSRRVLSTVVGNFSNALDDPNIQSGVELGIFPCESSSRQLWTISTDGQLKLTVAATADIQAPDAVAVALCVSLGSSSSSYLGLEVCSSSDTSLSVRFDRRSVNPSVTSKFRRDHVVNSDIYNLVRTVNGIDTDKCLTIAPREKNDNVDVGGGNVILTRCDTADISQLWLFQETYKGVDGRAAAVNIVPMSDVSSHVSCLTAGWPFLTASAFWTENYTAVVVMNESPSLTRYSISSSFQSSTLLLGISARSIQTVTY